MMCEMCCDEMDDDLMVCVQIGAETAECRADTEERMSDRQPS